MKEEFKKAIGHFNVIANVNDVITEYYTETGKAAMLVDLFNKEAKFSGALIYSAPLKIVLQSAGSKKNLIYDLKLDKMEIRYFLNKDRDDLLYGFRLGLTLLSSYNEHYLKSIMASFTIAASKDYNTYCIVCEENKRKIRDSEARYVQFSTWEDFNQVIELCREVIAEFNKYLSGEDKLLPHMDMR